MVSPDRAAEIFANVLSRAPLIPVVLAPPAAIVMTAAEAGVAHAEEECRIKVETYSPKYLILNPITSLEAPVPCDSTQLISALVPGETGIHKIFIKQAPKPETLLQLGMLAGAGILLTAAILAGPQRARDFVSRLRR